MLPAAAQMSTYRWLLLGMAFLVALTIIFLRILGVFHGESPATCELQVMTAQASVESRRILFGQLQIEMKYQI